LNQVLEHTFPMGQLGLGHLGLMVTRRMPETGVPGRRIPRFGQPQVPGKSVGREINDIGARFHDLSLIGRSDKEGHTRA
jgi:hypothetical protein